IEQVAMAALAVPKKAPQHRKTLSRDNFYGTKLSTLRADATNAFASLGSTSAGDTSSIAELIETTFAASTGPKARFAAVQELSYHLRTTWRSTPIPQEADGIFPLSILTQTKRGYLVTVGRQM